MFLKDHIKVKIVSFILLNILLSVVFFILSSIPDGGMYMWSWHLELIIVWYPITAAVYGIAAVITGFRDRGFCALMAVIFLAVALISSFAYQVVLWHAALAYTGIMLAAALITWLIRWLICANLQSYKKYKESKENKNV